MSRAVLLLFLLLNSANSQGISNYTNILAFFIIITISVIPGKYSVTTAARTTNGSSTTGHCSTVTDNNTTCLNSTSSVLFDGNIPTLTGLDGNMWASQLLTTRSSFDITFGFAGTPDFVGVRRVEIVLFNCPEWGISVQGITLQTSAGFAGTTNPTVTSCDSLVRVCIGDLSTSGVQTDLTLSFTPINPTNRVHIAEMSFYGAGPTCPDDTVITTPTPLPPDSTTITMSTSPPDSTMSTSPPDSTTITMSTSPPDTGLLPIILSAVFLSLLFILVCVVAILLLLWRCYIAKHRYSLDHTIISTRNNPLYNEEGENKALSTPCFTPVPDQKAEKANIPLTQLHSEEDVSTVIIIPDLSEIEPSLDPMNSTLDSTMKDTEISSSEPTSKLADQTVQDDKTNLAGNSEEKHSEDTLKQEKLGQPLYAKVNKKKNQSTCVMSSDSDTSESDTAVDQLYAQINKKKRRKKGVVATNLHASEVDTAMDQLYAQVDKKKSKKKKDAVATNPHASEVDTAVDQLYAQVNKKKSTKRKDANEESVEKSGAVYSVVNKPRAPQLPPKSDLLMEDEPRAPKLPPRSDLLMEELHKEIFTEFVQIEFS